MAPDRLAHHPRPASHARPGCAAPQPASELHPDPQGIGHGEESDTAEEDPDADEEHEDDATGEQPTPAAACWRVKVLDAVLSIKRPLIHASSSNPAAGVQTSLGRSVARTIAYQPSEVVGRPKGHVWVGPHSDIYSFGKLCCFGLTGRADPDSGDRVILSDAWNSLLDDTTAWIIAQRPSHVAMVVDRLAQLAGPGDLLGRIEREMYAATISDHTQILALDRTTSRPWSIAAMPMPARATWTRPSPISPGPWS